MTIPLKKINCSIHAMAETLKNNNLINNESFRRGWTNRKI